MQGYPSTLTSSDYRQQFLLLDGRKCAYLAGLAAMAAVEFDWLSQGLLNEPKEYILKLRKILVVIRDELSKETNRLDPFLSALLAPDTKDVSGLLSEVKRAVDVLDRMKTTAISTPEEFASARTFCTEFHNRARKLEDWFLRWL